LKSKLARQPTEPDYACSAYVLSMKTVRKKNLYLNNKFLFPVVPHLFYTEIKINK